MNTDKIAENVFRNVFHAPFSSSFFPVCLFVSLFGLFLSPALLLSLVQFEVPAHQETGEMST